MASTVRESVVSSNPCVIWDAISDMYAPKGWKYSYYASKKEWTPDPLRARVFQNSGAAKNALKGAFNRYYDGPEREPVVVEFHEELKRKA